MVKRTVQFGITWLVILLLLLYGNAIFTTAQATLPTAVATAASQDVNFPALTGPYKVGRTEFEWVDQSRDETFASVPGLKRDLMVYVWFPASVTKRTKLAAYMDGGRLWDIWTTGNHLSPFEGSVSVSHSGLESLVHTHAYNTSILDTTKPSYPVLIFVPGFYTTAFNYASIVEEVASHGYIVIATSNPYSTPVVSYPDGRLVESGAVGQANDLGSAALLKTWTQDVHFVLDQVQQLNQSDANFKGHLDLSRIGVFGHSFGGETTIQITSADPRIKAGIVFEAGGVAYSALSDLGAKPFLFVGGFMDDYISGLQHIQDKYRLAIDGATHLNYGDYGLLLPLIPEFNNSSDVERVGTIDPARGIQIVDSYVVAFFDHYLNGADLNWPTFPEAHLTSLK